MGHIRERCIYIDGKMNRKLFSLALASVFLFVFMSSLTSAHYYGYDNRYYDGYYDKYSYHSRRDYGGYYGQYSKTVDYDKVKSSRYIGYGGWETKTTYTKTVREWPGYGSYPKYDYYYGPYSYNYPKNYYYG